MKEGDCMGEILITKKMVKKNKALKCIQKEDLKAHKLPRTQFPKAKLGKVVRSENRQLLDCSQAEEKSCNMTQLTKEAILEVIEKNNIIGLSGSCFETAKKIRAVMQAPSQHKYFIINAVACDPGLLHDEWLLEHKEEEIRRGVEIISKLVTFDKIITASHYNVPRRYPMGAERLLIDYFLGKTLTKEDMPAEKGILVLNVQTVYAVYEAFYKSKSEETKYLTILNLDTGNAEIVRVALGSTYEQVLKKTSLYTSNKQTFYAGMGLMDAEEIQLTDVITKQINMIAAGKRAVIDDGAKCKGCGRCTRHCPMYIEVSKLVKSVQKEKHFDKTALGISKCIGCGTCTYYCAGGLNPMKFVKAQL